MKKLNLISLFVFLNIVSFAQESSTDVNILQTVIIDSDTIPIVFFPEFEVRVQRTPRVFASKKEEKRYNKLRKDVETVWPYAELAGNLLNGYNKDLAQIKSKKERREYTRKIQEELEEEFSSDLIDLSMSQQVILMVNSLVVISYVELILFRDVPPH